MLKISKICVFFQQKIIVEENRKSLRIFWNFLFFKLESSTQNTCLKLSISGN
jgi:hypothetical protein